MPIDLDQGHCESFGRATSIMIATINEPPMMEAPPSLRE